MVEQENGVFTEEGYCFRFEEGWNDVYDEKMQNFKEESNCPILICLEVGEKGGYREAWIDVYKRQDKERCGPLFFRNGRKDRAAGQAGGVPHCSHERKKRDIHAGCAADEQCRRED